MHTSLAVRRAFVAVLAALSMLVAGLGGTLPASLGRGRQRPEALSPNSTTVRRGPDPAVGPGSGAERYDVEVSSSSFATNLWSTTTNRRATPQVQLPSGTVHWRVRASAPTAPARGARRARA